jgi:hypothetical protein
LTRFFSTESSSTWKSIEYSLDLPKKCIIGRVRSGTKVNIWRDAWIPRSPSFKVSLKKGRSRLRWVAQLMKPNRRDWDEHVIRSCMYPVDADEVLKIRLTKRGDEDLTI